MADYTEHYQLHQWEPEDSFLRTDFNQDHQKLDDALHGLAQQDAAINNSISALELTMAGFGNCCIEHSFYVGTGTSGQSGKASITFPKEPFLVILVNNNGQAYFLYKGMSTTVDSPQGDIYFQWSGNTISWYANFGSVINVLGISYRVIAFYASET